MAIRNKSFGLKNILVLVLGIAFGIVAIAIGYDALSGNSDLRSKAASSTFTYKQWTFASTTEGWLGIGKNVVSAIGGHLQLAISVSRNVPTITNSQVNVSMPTGKKYLALTIAVDSSSKFKDKSAVVRTALTQAQVAQSQDIDQTFAVKSGTTICTQEVMICPDGSYVGRTGANCAFATCPVVPTAQGKPVSMLVYYKLANADWNKVPLTYSGNLSSSYQRFMIPFPVVLPEGGPITITGLRITFPSGLSQNDTVRIDDISLLGLTTPVVTSPTPPGGKCFNQCDPKTNTCTVVCATTPVATRIPTPTPTFCKANTMLYANDDTKCKGPTDVGSMFRCPDGYQGRLTFTTCSTDAQVDVLNTQYCITNNHCGHGTPTPVAATYTPTPTPQTPILITATPTPTVSPNQYKVTIVSPNGGELLTFGQTYTIQWDSSHNFDTVSLYYATDGGFSGSITGNIADTGSYVWQVNPVYGKGSYRIYINGNIGQYNYANDASDGYFTIR